MNLSPEGIAILQRLSNQRFTLPQFHGNHFRLLNLDNGMTIDQKVAQRMLVVEVERPSGWLDFATVREDDVAYLADATIL